MIHFYLPPLLFFYYLPSLEKNYFLFPLIYHLSHRMFPSYRIGMLGITFFIENFYVIVFYSIFCIIWAHGLVSVRRMRSALSVQIYKKVNLPTVICPYHSQRAHGLVGYARGSLFPCAENDVALTSAGSFDLMVETAEVGSSNLPEPTIPFLYFLVGSGVEFRGNSATFHVILDSAFSLVLM